MEHFTSLNCNLMQRDICRFDKIGIAVRAKSIVWEMLRLFSKRTLVRLSEFLCGYWIIFLPLLVWLEEGECWVVYTLCLWPAGWCHVSRDSRVLSNESVSWSACPGRMPATYKSRVTKFYLISLQDVWWWPGLHGYNIMLHTNGQEDSIQTSGHTKDLKCK